MEVEGWVVFLSGMCCEPDMTPWARRPPDLANFLGEQWEAPWLRSQADSVSWAAPSIRR